MPDARRLPTALESRPLPASAAPGSPVSRGRLLEDRDVQRLLRHDLLQPAVLLLQALEPPRLLDLQAPVHLPPPVIGLLGDLELAADLRRRPATGRLDLRLPQFVDDLLSNEPLLCHRLPLSRSRSKVRNSTSDPGLVSGGQVRSARLRARGHPSRDCLARRRHPTRKCHQTEELTNRRRRLLTSGSAHPDDPEAGWLGGADSVRQHRSNLASEC